jgi:Tol biopolymer transport system component
MKNTTALALGVAFTGLLIAGAAQSGRQPDARPVGNGKIAFAQDGSIMVFDAGGDGRAQRLAHGWNPAWSPDGRTLAFADDVSSSVATLFVMNADGSDRHRFPIASGGERNVSNYGPAWSPDGTRLAFTRSVTHPRTRTGWAVDVHIVGLDGTNLHRVTTSGTAYAPTWSPDGRRLAYLGVVGAVGSSDSSSRLHVVNVDGTGDRTLLAASRAAWAPGGHAVIWPLAWSPDGRRIAFSRPARSPTTRAGASEIYVIDTDGSGLRRLTRTAARMQLPSGDVVHADSIWPAWSPDGKQIVFVSLPNRLQVMNADGSGLRRVFRARPIGRFGGVSWQPVP